MSRDTPNTYIFCFDGTCNDPEDASEYAKDDSVTNIAKLHAMFGGVFGDDEIEFSAPDGGKQRSFYYSGVGTYGGWLRKTFNMLSGIPSGDVGKIIRAGLKDFEDHCEDNDRILIFGFSRGAAIARRFASRLSEEGKKMRFLGVFDTVAAMGLPDLNADTRPASDVVFENGTMAASIEKAVHLVALDEKRLAFRPTLFNRDERVLEVWFPGAHADVGGGFWRDGLSDVALRFMIEQIKKECSDEVEILEAENIDLDKLNGRGDENNICRDDLSINPLAHGELHAQSRPSAIAAKTLAARLVCVNENDKASDKLPLVHCAVRERFRKVTGYRPIALRGRRYRILDESGQTSECEGIADLRRNA